MKIFNKRFGFTLAEILFALVIVGTISALTIPSIVEGINARILATQAKNTQLSISNVISQLMTDQRVNRFETVANRFILVDMFTTIHSEKADVFPDTVNYHNLAGSQFEIPDDNDYALTDNGTAFGTVILNGSGEPGPDACMSVIYYDVNGADRPNIAGRDLFATYITKKGNFVDYETCKTLTSVSVLEPIDENAPDDETQDEKILRYCVNADDMKKLSECTLLLERNNWTMNY